MEVSEFKVFHKWTPEGYVFTDDTHEVHMTEKGKRIAEDTYERHNTFCRLLTGLGVDEKTAAADACEMEHAVSPESYEAFKRLVVFITVNGFFVNNIPSGK